ncbi:leucine-rich repeat receptor protein kinase EMS1 [Tanacetum coccineum]
MEFDGELRQESVILTTKHYVVGVLGLHCLVQVSKGSKVFQHLVINFYCFRNVVDNCLFYNDCGNKRFHRIKERPDCEDPASEKQQFSDHNLYLLSDGWVRTDLQSSVLNGKIVCSQELKPVKSQEKLLVDDYMANGSLDHWLRTCTEDMGVLTWAKRFRIAILSPELLILGLARLISACKTHVSTDLAGTFGYIPPEYGQSWWSTTKGDVYSFGVILLELVTGKEPTGLEFKDV